MTKRKRPAPSKQPTAHAAGRAEDAPIHVHPIGDASQEVDNNLQVRYRMALDLLLIQKGKSFGDLQLAACLVATQSIAKQLVPATDGGLTTFSPHPVSGRTSTGAAINEPENDRAQNFRDMFLLLSKQLAALADTGRLMREATQQLQASTEKMTRNMSGVRQNLGKFNLPR